MQISYLSIPVRGWVTSSVSESGCLFIPVYLLMGKVTHLHGQESRPTVWGQQGGLLFQEILMKEHRAKEEYSLLKYLMKFALLGFGFA